jgi:hypothetical protein
MNYWKILFIVTLIALIGFLIYFSMSKNKTPSTGRIIWKSDTIMKVLPQKIVEIRNAKPKIIYLKDTIIETQPFIAKLDTIIRRDTIWAEYVFPENSFSLGYRSQSDSLLQITNTMTKTETYWVEKAAYLLGGILFGIIITK